MSRLKIKLCEFLFFREMLIFKGFIDYSIFFRPGSSLESRPFLLAYASHLSVQNLAL